MHVVECPGCGRKFKVPRPVVRRQMTCSRCGASFVGSSVAAPDPAPAAPPRTAQAPAAAGPRPIPPQRSTAGPVMLVVCILGLIGIAVLGIVALLRYSGALKPHTIVRVKDGPGPPVAPRGPGPRRRPGMSDDSPTSPRQTPSPPRRTPTPGQPPVAAPDPRGDPMLDVGRQVVTGGAVGEEMFVTGRIRNRYTHPLKSVTVIAWVRGMEGPSRTYFHVPPQGHILYSLRLASGRKLSDEDVRVVATAVRAAADVLIWQIPDEDLKPVQRGDKYVWSGRTRNPYDTAVTDVKIVIDYFDADGIQYGTVTGKLQDNRRSIGAGKTGWYRAATDDFKVGGARKIAARAVGKRH